MLLIFLVVWTGMHVFVFSRAATVPLIKQHIPLWVLVTIAALLWPTYVLARIFSQTGLEFVGHILEHIGAAWIGILFLALVCLLAADLVTGFGYLLPRTAPAARGWALGLTLVLAIIATGQALRPPVLREYEVRMRNLPPEADGAVMVVASDLHAGRLNGPQYLQTRVREIQALKPDLIILAGDIAEGDDSSRRALLPEFRALFAPLGVWAVTGNHEHYSGADASARMLEEAGIRVLRDRWAEARPGLVIAGVDDLTVRRRDVAEKRFVSNSLAGRPDGATILISHTPWETAEANQAGVGLMLSGHTHNGQIWPFTYIVQLTYPHIYGDYKIGDMTLIVCRGTGTWGPRMRLWNRSELLRVTLRKA